jgi:hypothetical protein
MITACSFCSPPSPFQLSDQTFNKTDFAIQYQGIGLKYGLSRIHKSSFKWINIDKYPKALFELASSDRFSPHFAGFKIDSILDTMSAIM